MTVVQGVLLTPPPYRDPGQIVLISPVQKQGRELSGEWTMGQIQEFQRGLRSFETIAGYGWTFDFVVRPEGSEPVRGMDVTKEYFSVIGVHPFLGREFQDGDAPLDYWNQTVMILGHDLWRRSFHSDRSIIGKTVRLGIFEKGLRVIGVMPEGVRFLPVQTAAHEPNYDPNAKVDFWIPITPNPAKLREVRASVIGRMRPGVPRIQAKAELDIVASHEGLIDQSFAGVSASVVPIMEDFNREGKKLLVPLIGFVALVFFIACANVAGLLLAHGLHRQQEYALRNALGAGPGRLFWQMLTESLGLGVPAAIFGFVLSVLSVKVLRAIGVAAIPRLDSVQVQPATFLFCGAAALLAAGLAGLAPAIRAEQSEFTPNLKSVRTAGGSRRDQRLLAAVAVLQIALTLALLVGAGLLGRTVRNLTGIHPGFVFKNILTMNVSDMNWGNYYEFHARALDRLEGLPGVKRVGFAWGVPLTGETWIGHKELEGHPETGTVKDHLQIPVRSVTPNYFAMIGQRIVAGQGFPVKYVVPTKWPIPKRVAIVNQAFAKRFFPGSTPIGKRLKDLGEKEWSVEIIGVVEDTRTDSLTQGAEPEIYMSFWEALMRTKRVLIETTREPSTVAALVQRELHAVEPTVAIESVKTLAQIRNESMAPQLFTLRIVSAFSMIATSLALVGIYGVLSLSVAFRSREIATRIAIGASRWDILKDVLGEGLRLTFFGLAAGTGISLAFAQVLRGLLFGVDPIDPLTFGSATFLFCAVALAACSIPAIAATRVDALMALRSD